MAEEMGSLMEKVILKEFVELKDANVKFKN